MHLTEVLETICNKMDDYVRATYKTSGELTLLRLIGADGQMNPDLSHVDIVQDSDLNRSLKFYVSHTNSTRSGMEVCVYLHMIFVSTPLCSKELKVVVDIKISPVLVSGHMLTGDFCSFEYCTSHNLHNEQRV
jgi:hypothetical protein